MGRVDVVVGYSVDAEGIISPERIKWPDGRVWRIKRVLHTCKSPDQSFEGIRYTVLIGEQEKYLYHAGQVWYVFASQEGGSCENAGDKCGDRRSGGEPDPQVYRHQNSVSEVC